MSCTRTPPAAPSGFVASNLVEGVHWHQRWEVFEGVWTPGHNDVQKLLRCAQLPADLTGKRVLDVGAFNGCFSFECERRGAQVVALDLMNPEKTGFDRLRLLLRSNVQFVQGSVYDLDPVQHGRFDLILFFGVLYHLRYPLLAVDRMRTVCRGDILIETHVIDHHFPARNPLTRLLGKLLLRLTRDLPIWRQYRELELHPEDRSNLFGPNIPAVMETFSTAGFETEHLCSWDDRAAFRARLNAQKPSRTERHTYEARFSTTAKLAGVSRIEDPMFVESCGRYETGPDRGTQDRLS